MPSTHTSLHYHLIFSTKDRRPSIRREWQPRLHSYLGGVVRKCGGTPECIGGTSDHLHLLVGLKATHRLSDMLREIKQGSSQWVHESLGVRQFRWQDGYGAFTVSAERREALIHYIRNQEAHHQKRTSLEEYVEFLRAAGLEYDERYL